MNRKQYSRKTKKHAVDTSDLQFIHVDPKSNFLQHYIKETAIEENTKD